MKNTISALFKDSFIFGILSQVARLSPIIIIPIISKNFNQEIFAIFDSLNVLGFIFLAIAILGQDSSIARYYYEYENSREKRRVVGNALVIEGVFTFLLVIIIILNIKWILNGYLNTDKYGDLLLMVAIALPFRMLTQFWQNLLKWTLEKLKFSILTIGQTILLIASILLAIEVLEYGIEGVFYCYIIVNVLTALLGLWYCRKKISLSVDFKLQKQLISYGWPYMLIGLSGQLFPAIDREIITSEFKLEVLASYALSYKLVSLLKIPIGAFQMAWGPHAFRIYKDSDAEKTYNFILKMFTILISFFGLVIVLFGKELILIFGTKEYLNGFDFFIPLVLSIIIDSLSWISGIGIDLAKKTFLSGISYVLGIIVSYVLMKLLIVPFGIIGLCYGFLIGKLFLTGLKTIFAYKVYPLRFQILPILSILTILFLASIGYVQLNHKGLYLLNYPAIMIFISATCLLYKYIIASVKMLK